jgi:translation initiation factor 3 subunit M
LHLYASELSYDYSIIYVRSLPPKSESTTSAAIELVAQALRLPIIFDFDPLFNLDAVVALKGHEIFELLQIFLNDGLKEFKSWAEAHDGAFAKYSKLSFSSMI